MTKANKMLLLRQNIYIAIEKFGISWHVDELALYISEHWQGYKYPKYKKNIMQM